MVFSGADKMILTCCCTYNQGRNEGGKIPREPNHYGGAEKSQEMSQVLSSIQYICFRKTSGLNMGAPNLLLAPGAK